MTDKSEFTSANLFKELQGAIDADKKYWIRNDAKLRAVVTAKTYDEFREIVAAAHLQPVTRGDVQEKRCNWNAVARKKRPQE